MWRQQMNCKQVQRRLNAYLDGELPAEMRQTLEAHLDGCSACAHEWAAHQKLRQLLDEPPTATVPEGFARLVRERASRHAVSVRRRATPEVWRAYPIPVRAAAMLALGAGLLVGGLMGNSAALVRTTEQAAATGQAEENLSLGLVGALAPGSLAEDYLELTGNSEVTENNG
jgi:anti-sigma factor (TIGR02949 family)